MTDQSKIPLPQDGEGQPRTDSLIERAVESFGWGKLAPPPPVPTNLRPASPRPEPEVRKPEVAPLPPVTADPVPVVDQAEPEPLAPEPAPVAVAREPDPVLVAPTPAPEPAVAPVAVQPAPGSVQAARTFEGALHPIDREHLRQQGFIVPEGAVSGLFEEFRIVKRQLLLQAADLRRRGAGGKAQRVLICSPHPGEGKTYCAVNLALSIAAEKESEVLLVDADFAKPSVLSALGLPGGRGLMDALADTSLDVADLVLGTDVSGLKVLPAGDATNRDSEYLSTSRTATLLDRLTEGVANRIVIFDSPPALAASPAAELAKYVGQALVICRADRTGQQSLEDAISLLSGCPNIQLLLNAANFSPSGRRFGAYYGYGA